MERGQTEAGRRKIGIVWAASLVATAVVVFLASSYFLGAFPGNAGGKTGRKQMLISEMRTNLARAAEKEKCAVLSLNDEESRDYADQSRAASEKVDHDLRILENLIGQSGTDRERELLKKFDGLWKNLRQTDMELLESAEQNTNMKAIDLSGTIGSELLQKLHDDLSKIAMKVNPPSRRTELDRIAGQAEIAALNIAILQMRHIQAPSTAEKSAIETSIKGAEQKGNAALKTLQALAGKKGNPFMKGAITEFGELLQVNEEILRLSNINSNRRAIEISLGRKRLADAECDRALKAFQASVNGGMD
jgi:hypothetical protein